MRLNKTLVNPLAAMALAATPIAAIADEEEIPFDVAEIFFELNDTDGDLGIHALIDGDEWKRLVIEDTQERTMLKVNVRGRLRRQGLTELFFESAEPTFDELDPEVFFARFPEGDYPVEGVSLDGDEMESETNITHRLPAPPQPDVNGYGFADDCDEDVPVIAEDDVTISWEPVTMSHPELGRTNEPVEVVNYEIVVEIDDTPWKATAVLPAGTTEFEVPDEILAIALEESDGELKYEVLVREASFNQTATESCFAVTDAVLDD
jgi:hypothetical protein